MGKNDLVDEWRKEHRDELDRTLAVLISIRDDPDEKSKDRVDASKAIARMLGGLAPDKVIAGDKMTAARPDMDIALKAELEKYLDAV